MMASLPRIRRNDVHTGPAYTAGPDFSEVESMPTTLYGEFPQFDGLTGGELARAILEARLSPTDVQISTSRLIWGMEYADIGAAVGMDRSAVAKRLRGQIVPRLEMAIQGARRYG